MNEAFVDADGFRIRYLEAGQGEPLVYLHGAGGLRPSRAHDLLAERFHLFAFEVPGFGASAVNERSRSFQELGATMVNAACAITHGERFNLWGTSFGGALAVWMAAGAPDALQALVLEGPAAIVPEGTTRPSGSPEEMRQRLYAHPERQPAAAPTDPAIAAKQRGFLDRLARPTRDETVAALATIRVPTLVVFGTHDRVISPEMGRVYRETMPNCNYVLLYDAGHEAAAERPEAFRNLVADFLVRREAFIVSERSSLLNP